VAPVYGLFMNLLYLSLTQYIMLPQQVQDASDAQLAKLVQLNGSNDAMTEIINRHTGVYLSVVNSFNIPPLQKNDLLDSKNTNIYKYTLKFDESKKCKLSSFFYQNAYWDCLKTLEKTEKTEEISDEQFTESFTYSDDASVKSVSLQIARNIGGRDFEKIVEARHFADDSGKISWHKIDLPYSYEKSRTIYNKFIDAFKVEIKNKFNYVKL
jgi:hypothetical protein